MVYHVMLTIGLILALIATFTLSRSLLFLKRSERAVARVIQLEVVHDNEGVTYKPIFQFTTALHENITYAYPFSSAPSHWDIGDTATIAYNTNDPGKAKVLTYFGTFGLTTILLSIAMPLLVISGGFYLSKQFLI